MVYRHVAERASTKTRPIGPSSPYGVSKLAQEMLGAARDAMPGHPRAAVQSCRAAAGADVRDVELRAADRRDRSRASRARCCASATSTRAATSPTCATRCGRTGCWSSAARPAARTTSAAGGPTGSPTCSTSSSRCRGRRSRSSRIPRACGRATTPSSSAIARACERETGWQPTIPIERTLARPARLLARRTPADAMTARRASPRTGRQLLHMAMGGFALLLRYLAWWEAAALAGFGARLQPLRAPAHRRASPVSARASTRAVSAPASRSTRWRSCCSSASFPIGSTSSRPRGASSRWATAWPRSSGAASAGRAFPGTARSRSPGVAAFVVFGGAAGALLCWWCPPAVIPPPYLWFSSAAPFVAALAAAAVETIPIRLDDNLSVPATAAAVLWCAVARQRGPAPRLPPRGCASAACRSPLAVNVAVAVVGYLGAHGLTIRARWRRAHRHRRRCSSTGGRGWALLLATFAAAAIASRLGLRRKTLLGIAEARGGRRGAGNAIANTGVAAAAATAGRRQLRGTTRR